MTSDRRSGILSRAALAAGAALLWPRTLQAEQDRFDLGAHAETQIQLFRRALLPGATGALVTNETALPVHQAWSLRAGNLDALGAEDNLDLEFAAWGRLWPTRSELEPVFDGDVQTASVRLRLGPAWLRAGRQHVAGGAARFSRFDGVLAGASHASGAVVEAYGGFSVQPLWDERLTYRFLGALEGELLRDAPEPVNRSEHWLAGGRLGYSRGLLDASLSVHEQHESAGLERRNLGLDVSAQPYRAASLSGSALLELDARRLASLRLWSDLRFHPALDLNVEYLRAEPALLLSRASVLSVFSRDAYDEVGAAATWRALDWLALDANGYAESYARGRLGTRGELGARFSSGDPYPTTVRLSYTRVVAPENGYHSLRTALRRVLTRSLATTLEAYGYFYDAPIAGYRASSVYSATLAYRARPELELLWGGSLARSPYAALDAQTLVRVSYDLDASPGRPR